MKTLTRTNIGSAMHALRTGQHLTLNEAADAFATTASSYSNYERGRSLPDIKILIRMSVYYHINIEFLIFLLCIDMASVEKISNEDLFHLFTYDYKFDWDFFQIFEQYDALPQECKHAVDTFLHAADLYSKKIM